MKIAGVAGDKHPTLRKGDPIELTKEQKLLAIAKDVLVQNSKEGFKNIPIKLDILGDIIVTEGRKDLKNPEPNMYFGEVNAVYKTLDLAKDEVHENKSCIISVRFRDSKDELGCPDLEILSYQVK